MDPETLDQAGRLLLGPDWKLPMASLLGPYHPEGARERIDPRLVRRWAVGDRPIPPWVAPVLASLLQERSKQLASDAKHAGFLAQFLKNGSRRG
jgi:hypothetical protein